MPQTAQQATRTRPWLLVGWLAMLVGAVWLFGRLGSGPLAAPPVSDLEALGHWYAARSAPEVLLALTRVGVQALGWYLLAVTALGGASRLLRAARAVEVSDALTIPAVRRLLHGALGAWLAAGAVTHALPAHASDPPPAHAVPHAPDDEAEGQDDAARPTIPPLPLDAPLPIDGPGYLPPRPHPGAGAALASSPVGPGQTHPEADGAHDSSLVGAGEVPSARAHGVPEGQEPAPGASQRGRADHREATGAQATSDEPEVAQSDGPGRPDSRQEPSAGGSGEGAPGTAGSAGDSTGPAAPDGVGTHTIEAGEHLWAVAEQALAGAWERGPTDAEIVPYWLEMIERNRHRLPDPANPDLVHPGLTVDLPAVPALPAP